MRFDRPSYCCHVNHGEYFVYWRSISLLFGDVALKQPLGDKALSLQQMIWADCILAKTFAVIFLQERPSTAIRHRSDTFVSDWCPRNVVPVNQQQWVSLSAGLTLQPMKRLSSGLIPTTWLMGINLISITIELNNQGSHLLTDIS